MSFAPVNIRIYAAFFGYKKSVVFLWRQCFKYSCMMKFTQELHNRMYRIKNWNWGFEEYRWIWRGFCMRVLAIYMFHTIEYYEEFIIFCINLHTNNDKNLPLWKTLGKICLEVTLGMRDVNERLIDKYGRFKFYLSLRYNNICFQ